jgi:hypothetical protein
MIATGYMATGILVSLRGDLAGGRIAVGAVVMVCWWHIEHE